MQKLRVGVLMGGKSQEREVSFNSGRTVCDHLDTCRYEIIPIFQTENGNLFLLPWHFLHRGKTNDFRHRLESEATQIKWDELKNIVDFVFIAMHGQFAEDGTVQGFLEILNIPYLGSKVFGSAIGMNKIIQKEFLRANGIEVAKGIAVYPYQIRNFEKYKTEIFAALEKAGANPPFIIKPHKEGSSLGVEAVLKTEDLHAALQRASCVNPESEQPVLIEEKIKGMEVSCCVITDYKTGKLIPLTPTEIVIDKNKHFHDYKEKYMPGLGYEHTPARCNDIDTELIKKTCVRVMDILKIENIGRVDGFLTEDKRFIVIDPNTLTGMGPSSFFFREAAENNINHTQLINHVIETELNNYGLLEKIINHEEKVKEEASMTSKKIRVAILMGGATNEKEISFESGRNITYKLSPQKYETIPVFVDKNMDLYKINNKHLVRKSTHEVQDLLNQKDKENNATNLKINWNDLPTIADFVFIALHGGQGENGCVQGTLEMLGMPYNGSSVLASALCANKFETNKFLESQGFTVPASVLVEKEDFLLDKAVIIKNILDKLNLPIILKPHDDGCSTMVCKIKNAQELEASLTEFFTTDKHIAMAEEEIIGMELTVGVIGNNQPIALPPSQAVATKGILSLEEKFLPGAGENQTPAPLPQEALKLVQKQMELAYSALGCAGYVRIDCFYQSAEQSRTKQERVIFLEVNTLPGMTPATCIFHQAAEIGIRPMDFIDLIIELGLEKHKNIYCSHNIFKDTNKQEKNSITENLHANNSHSKTQ